MTPGQRCGYANQRGTALVFSMVILLILTILGISAMRTTALEQLMAGNTQEMTRAFQAADSGMAKALDFMRTSASTGVTADPGAFATASYPFGTATASATTPTFLQIGQGARGESGSGDNFCFAFHNQDVTGRGQLNVARALSHGLRTAAPGDTNRETPCS